MMTRHGVNVREKKVGFKLLEGRSPKKKEKKKAKWIIWEFGKDLHFCFKSIANFFKGSPLNITYIVLYP